MDLNEIGAFWEGDKTEALNRWDGRGASTAVLASVSY